MVLYSNLETNFVKKALANGIRLDGRKPFEFREMNFLFDSEQRGSVIVKRGLTQVVASVYATLTSPFPDRPADGIVNFHVNLSPTAAPDLPEYEEVEDWEEQESSLTLLLDRILKSTRVVDTESLCVIPGSQVWNVKVRVRVFAIGGIATLNGDQQGEGTAIATGDGGSIVDVVIAASVAALLDFRRPETAITSDEGDDNPKVRIFSAFERHPVPLTLHNPPIAVTLAVINLNDQEGNTAIANNNEGVETSLSMMNSNYENDDKIVMIADPTTLEERLGGRVIIALNRPGELVTWVKRGGPAVDVSRLEDDAMIWARARSIALLDKIKVALTSRK